MAVVVLDEAELDEEVEIDEEEDDDEDDDEEYGPTFLSFNSDWFSPLFKKNKIKKFQEI